MASFKLDFVTLDVFTNVKFRGNPLAVVKVPPQHRDALTQETKQKIATEFNLSETVFLHTDDAASERTWRDMDIFTVAEELPFAGHPTIGAASLVLHELRLASVTRLAAQAGPISIAAGPADGLTRASIPHDVHIHARTLADAAVPADGLSPHAAVRALELRSPVASIVNGMAFVLVGLPSLALLAEAGGGRGRLDFAPLRDQLLDEGWRESFCARYYYVALESRPSAGGRRLGRTLRARMVEMAAEDPATGSAACALAAYLALTDGACLEAAVADGVEFEVVQGVEMGRESRITVEVFAEKAEGGARIKEVVLGGKAVVVMEGSITV